MQHTRAICNANIGTHRDKIGNSGLCTGHELQRKWKLSTLQFLFVSHSEDSLKRRILGTKPRAAHNPSIGRYSPNSNLSGLGACTPQVQTLLTSGLFHPSPSQIRGICSRGPTQAYGPDHRASYSTVHSLAKRLLQTHRPTYLHDMHCIRTKREISQCRI